MLEVKFTVFPLCQVAVLEEQLTAAQSEIK